MFRIIPFFYLVFVLSHLSVPFSSLGSHCCSAQDDDQSAADKRKISVLMRLKNIDVNEKPKLKTVVIRFLKTVNDEAEYLDYAERFRIVETEERLWQIANQSKNNNSRLKAANLLIQQNDAKVLVEKILLDKQPELMIEAVALVASKTGMEILKPLVTNTKLTPKAKNNAVNGLGRQVAGQRFLLDLLNSKKLPEECKFTAGNILLFSQDDTIKNAAQKILKWPAGVDSKPIAPLSVLVQKKGDIENGKRLFAKKGTCANCHKVSGQGKEVGPDLTEIGSKLSRQAMFESILDPSQAVSHNYETYLIETIDGLSFSGVLVSDTDEKVVIRTAEAITREIVKEDIEGMKKSKKSLMPADLQKALKESELIDLVEYLMTLKKK